MNLGDLLDSRGTELIGGSNALSALCSSSCRTFVKVNIYSLGAYVIDKSGLRGFILVSLAFSHSTKVDTILLSIARCLKINFQ